MENSDSVFMLPEERISSNHELGDALTFDWTGIGIEEPEKYPEIETPKFEEKKQAPLEFITIIINLSLNSQSSSRTCTIEKPLTMPKLQELIRKEFLLSISDIIKSIKLNGMIDIENDEESNSFIEDSSKLEVTAISLKVDNNSSTELPNPTKSSKLDAKPEDWMSEQVCDWLINNNLQILQEVFKTKNIDGKLLLSTTEQEWKEIIPATVVRRRLLNSVKSLK